MSKNKKNRTRQKTNPGKKRKKSVKTNNCGISRLMSAAIALSEQGDINKARKLLIKALNKAPNNADVLYNLGIMTKESGKTDDALRYYEKAISIAPDYTNAYFNIGGILIDLKQYDKAKEMFLKVISISPDYINAFLNLGLIAREKGKFDEAIGYYQKALLIVPDDTDVLYNIGCVLMDQNKNTEAFELFDQIAKANPKLPETAFNMGSIMHAKKNYPEAIKYYEKTLAIEPQYFQAHNNLGIIYQEKHNFDKAISHYETAIEICSQYADAYMNIANIYRTTGDAQKTIEYYKKSISAKPSLIAISNLCGFQKEQSNYHEVNELTKQILQYDNLNKTDFSGIHDTYIQTCQWDKASDIIKNFKAAKMNPEQRDVLAGSFMEFCAITDLTVDEISELHKKWGQWTEENATPFAHDKNDRMHPEGRKIKIGYISPDLREHSVGYLIKDIITHHNKDNFEIYCYANMDPKDCDSFTQEMINHSKLFKYIKHLTDKKAAEEIYNDKIDIAIDLAGHTAGHRLRSLACKPAPIQMTYLGYPNTTGLSCIDYRVTDRFAETDESKDYRYAEKLLRLTNCFLTFKGFGDVVPVEIKKSSDGKIIFGCFNNIQKLTPRAVALWSQILKNVEGSVLHLKAKQLNTQFIWENITKEFAKYKIDSERLVCLGYTATREDHLRLYNDIDIALDTFPYNGTVTTLEALWMNMPVITLVGESHAQRVGYSILKNLDLDQLIAFNEDEYIEKAVELAERPEIIKKLKTRMRKNLLASSICNPIVFVREFELNLKKIWLKHLESNDKAEVNGLKNEGISEKQVEKTPEAEEALQKAISDTSRLRMAMVKLKAGEFKKAAKISSSLVGNNGVSPLAWYVLGVSRYHLGDDKKAMEALKKSLSLNNENIGALKMLGEIYLTKKHFDEANNCLKKIWEFPSPPTPGPPLAGIK